MAKKRTALDLEENVEAALCYVLGFVSGAFFYLIEEKNKTIRFHASQSIIVFFGLFIVSILFGIILPILSTLVGLLGVILWLVLMFKAYQGEKYMLPVVGELAEKFARGSK